MSMYQVVEGMVVVEAAEEEVMAEVLMAVVMGTTKIKEDLRKNKRKLKLIKSKLMLLKKNKK